MFVTVYFVSRICAPGISEQPAASALISGIARKNFLPRQSLYIDLIERSDSDSTDSQTLSSMGGTVFTG